MRRHHKWEVSVSFRGLTLIGRQRNTLPLFYFYLDRLRIDQVLALLWHEHKNKINLDVLFIYFPSSISVTLWDVSMSGCLRSPSDIDVKSPLASVKQSDSSANCIWVCSSPQFTFTPAYLDTPSWFFIFLYFPSFSPVAFLFPSFHHHLSPHLQIWHHI